MDYFTDACLKEDCKNFLNEDDVNDEVGSDEEEHEYDEQLFIVTILLLFCCL